MDYNQILSMASFANISPGFIMLFGALSAWALVWKGFALWKAARNGSNIWFIVLLITNTVGILEILYIFFFSEKKKENTPVK